jgi:hypothetical protein
MLVLLYGLPQPSGPAVHGGAILLRQMLAYILSLFGYGVRAFLISSGIQEVRTAYRSPWQNPYIERFICTLRRELLDHVIVLNQARLARLLKEFIENYYHPARPQQGLAGETPLPQPPPGAGELVFVPVVGGLHHRYYRAAA